MMITIGENKYTNLVTDDDFVNIIDEMISHDFAREVSARLDWIAREEKPHETLLEDDAKFIEQENEELCNLIDEINSILQNLVVPIERGARIKRDNVIETLNKVIEMITNARNF